jgi:hypothetical protein
MTNNSLKYLISTKTNTKPWKPRQDVYISNNEDCVMLICLAIITWPSLSQHSFEVWNSKEKLAYWSQDIQIQGGKHNEYKS